jgi:hypothetical protein
MATVTGLVQRLFVVSGGGYACVYIGPTAAYVDALTVVRRTTDAPHTSAFRVSMVDALAQAMASRHEVTVQYEDSGPEILSVQLH